MSKATRFSTRLLKEAQPSLNKVGIIYENQQGIELAQWLSKESNRRALDNKRILYVVRANIDNSLIKFGVGGVEHGGTSAFGRLLQYVNYYGENGEFDCKGIKLFLIVANNYNANVEGKNSAIFRKDGLRVRPRSVPAPTAPRNLCHGTCAMIHVAVVDDD